MTKFKDWLSTAKQVYRMWKDKNRAEDEVRNAFREIMGYQIQSFDLSLMSFVTVMIQNLHIAGRLAKTSLQEAFNTLKKHSYTLSPAGKEQLKQLREARKAKRIGEAIIQNVMPFAPKPPAPKDRD